MSVMPMEEISDIITDLTTGVMSVVNPVAGTAATVAVQAYRAHFSRKVSKVLETAVNEHGVAIEQLQAAFSDERLSELIREATEAALNARGEEKLKLLAAIVAGGIIGDDMALTDAQALIPIIDGLEPVHLETLRKLNDKAGRDTASGESEHPGLSSSELTQQISQLNLLIRPVVGALTAQGLIENVGPGRMGGIGERERWGITGFGVWLLETLNRLGESHSGQD